MPLRCNAMLLKNAFGWRRNAPGVSTPCGSNTLTTLSRVSSENNLFFWDCKNSALCPLASTSLENSLDFSRLYGPPHHLPLSPQWTGSFSNPCALFSVPTACGCEGPFCPGKYWTPTALWVIPRGIVGQSKSIVVNATQNFGQITGIVVNVKEEGKIMSVPHFTRVGTNFFSKKFPSPGVFQGAIFDSFIV